MPAAGVTASPVRSATHDTHTTQSKRMCVDLMCQVYPFDQPNRSIDRTNQPNRTDRADSFVSQHFIFEIFHFLSGPFRLRGNSISHRNNNSNRYRKNEHNNLPSAIRVSVSVPVSACVSLCLCLEWVCGCVCVGVWMSGCECE